MLAVTLSELHSLLSTSLPWSCRSMRWFCCSCPLYCCQRSYWFSSLHAPLGGHFITMESTPTELKCADWNNVNTNNPRACQVTLHHKSSGQILSLIKWLKRTIEYRVLIAILPCHGFSQLSCCLMSTENFQDGQESFGQR